MPDEFPALNNVLLEIQVPDFKRVKKFYIKLGFEKIWERKPEEFKGYLIMKLEDNVLCFWGGNEHIYEQEYFKKFPKNTPRGVGMEIVLMVKDIEDYFEQVKNKVEIFEPLQDRPWGLKDFRVVDPFGFYLRFTSPHNILNSKYAVK